MYTCNTCQKQHKTNEICPVPIHKGYVHRIAEGKGHTFGKDNVCKNCGCSKTAIKGFKWDCDKRIDQMRKK